MTNPLVSIKTHKPQGEPQTDQLVTVKLAGGKESGGRITRIAHSTYFVKLNGLGVPQPYSIGMTLPLSRDDIIDWG